MYKKRLGFSLIELSIVILIIGILVIGVSKGSRIIQKARLSSAQSLTKSSSVNSMGGLVFWFETSLDDSFVSSENNDGTTISRWRDINPQSSRKLDAIAGSGSASNISTFYYNPAAGATAGNTSGPTYIKSGINGLPTLRFTNNGTTAFKYVTVDSAMKNIPSGSVNMFVVFKYRSGNGHIFDRACLSAAGAAVLAASCSDGGTPLFSLPVSAGNQLSTEVRPEGGGTFPSLGGGFTYNNTIISTGGTYIVTVQRKYNASFVTYVNGGSPSSTADNGASITMDPVKIGRHLNFSNNNDIDISELILITGGITEVERKAIEEYLSKKYAVKVS